jgi:hypothetical protein
VPSIWFRSLCSNVAIKSRPAQMLFRCIQPEKLTMRTLIILLLVLTIFSCNQSQTTQDKNLIQSTVIQTTTHKIVNLDTISKLFDNALKADTLEFDNWEPFLFFKSGNFLSKTEKNVIIVHCPTDTTYSIKLYSIKDNKWLLNDSINGLEAFPIQFYLSFDDYNFDGQTDIYIQVAASNGYSLSYGHLLTVGPVSKKFTEQIESGYLANMQPDIKTRTIMSDDVIWCKTNGMREVCKLTNKWIDGHLKTIKKDCPCEPE